MAGSMHGRTQRRRSARATSMAFDVGGAGDRRRARRAARSTRSATSARTALQPGERRRDRRHVDRVRVPRQRVLDGDGRGAARAGHRADRHVPGPRGRTARSRSTGVYRPRRPSSIVGASLAGVTAAATLREEGFDGRLVLLGEEELAALRAPGPVEGVPARRGARRRADVRARRLVRRRRTSSSVRGVVAERLDADRPHRARMADGESIAFEQALIATGSRNRRLEAPGVDLENVFDLRTVADADRIRAAAARTAAPPSCVGMGFIGAEVAASLRQLGRRRHGRRALRDRRSARSLGPEAGDVMARIHADHGVKMRFDDTVERVRRRRGRWSACARSLADDLEAAFAVVGIGVVSRTPSSGRWTAAADGGIPVDRHAPDRGARASARPATSRATTTRSSGGCGSSTSTTRSRWARRRRTTCSAPAASTTIRTGSGRTSTTSRSRWSGSGARGRDDRRARLVRGPVVLRLLARRRRRAPRRDVDRVAPGRPPRDQAGPAAGQARPGQARRPRGSRHLVS